MAVTSIWRVHGRVGKVLDYVENAEKTTAVSSGDGDLSDVIDYAIQQRKTSQTQVRDGEEVVQRFVSGINCHPNTAKMEMQKIKKFYGKEDGVIAYHGYQSFAPGEATPEIAHEIGIKLAQQLWGDRYQVLVATHLDRANHIKRVFDISQTTLTPTKQPAVSPDTRLLLNAMVRYAPCKVDFRDELPDGQSALYSPQEKTVFVRRGQSMEDVFRGVAQELAHAYLDTGNYTRENNIFLAQCVGNMLCQRNGIDGKSLAVTQLPQKYTEMEPKQLREYLKSIRTAANQISADMFRFLDAKSHGSRQRDDAR